MKQNLKKKSYVIMENLKSLNLADYYKNCVSIKNSKVKIFSYSGSFSRPNFAGLLNLSVEAMMRSSGSLFPSGRFASRPRDSLQTLPKSKQWELDS